MKRNIYKIIIPILLAIAFLTACNERKETFESPKGTNKVTISYDFASRPSVIYGGETIWKYEGSGFNEEVFFKVDWISENAFNLRYDDETHNGKYAEIFYIELEKEDTAENGDDTNTFELVSVEEFRDYYQLDNDISDEDIEGFIFDYDVTKERMGKYDMGKTLSDIISTGEDPNLGYHLSRIRSNGQVSDKKIEDFIKEANWIYIVFDLPSPQQDEFAYSENMVIDLKNSMIYFNANEENYRDAELSAQLSDEEIKNIYVEFPQNVGDYVADINPCLEYGYHIYVVDGNKNQLNYNEYTSDEKNKAFDSYWKKLYQQYFGKEYIFPQ